MNQKITLDYLEKIDECYIHALENALCFRGNFEFKTTRELTELLYLFRYHNKQLQIEYKESKGHTVVE